jgi:DHA2 family multidrug resistance protein
VVWVASLQIMLDKGRDLDWFNSPVIVALGLSALIGFAFFLVWEITEKNPIVDIRLFTQRNFAGGTIAISVAYGLFFGTLVLLPQWMQSYLGYRAVDSGLTTAPIGIFAVLLTPVMGRILPRSDPRVMATTAFVAFAVVFMMRTRFYADVSQASLVLPTLLQGIPMAMFFVPLTAIILSGLPPEKIPAAAGLSNFGRTFCGGIGTSVIGNVWNNRMILHHSRLTEQANLGNPIYTQQIDAMQSTLHLNQSSAQALFNLSVDRQAAVMGLNDIFYAAAVIFILIIPLIWITRPPKGGSGDALSSAGAH